MTKCLNTFQFENNCDKYLQSKFYEGYLCVIFFLLKLNYGFMVIQLGKSILRLIKI